MINQSAPWQAPRAFVSGREMQSPIEVSTSLWRWKTRWGVVGSMVIIVNDETRMAYDQVGPKFLTYILPQSGLVFRWVKG